MYHGQGKLNIFNNQIINNQARATSLDNGYYWSHGGGLSISSDNIDGPLHVTLEGNTISNNSAQLFGGGIYFFLSKKRGDQIDLKSGLFENNHSDFAGGAIDHSVHGQPVIHIENAVITGNKAVTGAGIWACPTSVVDSNSTFGAVISDNTLLDPITPPGSRTSGRNPLSSGTDVRFEGSDTSFKDYLSHNNPAIHKMTLVRRTFLGDWADWYKDNMEDLYEQGDLPMSPEDYTERSTTLGAKSMLPEDALSRALDASNLIFRNNTALRGGAISTNSDIQIGRPGDKSLQVKKVWLDDKGQTLDKNIPEAVEVTLVQKISNGDSKDLETVELSEANAWSWTFEELPASAIIKGETVLYDYEVREDSELTGYRSEQSVNMLDEKTIQVEIKNIRKPEETTTTSTSPSSSDETTTTTTATTTTTTTGTTTGQTTKTKQTTTELTHGTTAPTGSKHETPAAGESNNNFIVSTLCLTLATCFLWGKIQKKKRDGNAHRK
jgi:predicted outer membrane repeat protein